VSEHQGEMTEVGLAAHHEEYRWCLKRPGAGRVIPVQLVPGRAVAGPDSY
jgi:hypothetical protein